MKIQGTMKRTLTVTALSAMATVVLAATPPGVATKFVEVSRSEAAQEAAAPNALIEQSSSATMYIWGNRYVYRPGEQLTLRWTLRPNADFYPYTIVAYRVNNQTGVKSFLPGNSADPVDIFGQNLAQGFRITRLPEANKAVLVGAGGSVVNTALTIPEEYGMHTIVVQLRDYTGNRIIKSSYWKFGVVRENVELTGNIDSNRTLTNDRAYLLRGVVAVRNNATLTIEPGTFIFGQTGSQPPSVLLITRNGLINANGTRSQPIIMTSRTPSDEVGTRRRGDWGGLLMLGQAPGNVPAEQSFIEGLQQSDDARWGGTNADHNCGTLRYVRSEYSGVALSPNNETNSFVWAGCGRQTVAEHLQAHYGNDDSFEWFGGTSNAKWLVGTYGEDDIFDWQLGWTGNLQYALGLQNPTDRGNRGIEGDNSEFNQTAEPYSDPTVFNVTLVGSGQPGSSETSAPGVYLRRGSRGSLNNLLVTNWSSTGFLAENETTQAQITNNELTANGMLLWNNGLGSTPVAPNTVAGQVSAADRDFAAGTRGTGRNFLASAPLLRRPLEFSDPDFRPLVGSLVFQTNWILPPSNGFFDQSAAFIGAFGEDDWTEEWTNFRTETDVAP